MAIVLILASGCVWDYFCACVLSRRGQQKPEENLVARWRQACRAVAHGAATCACRATHLGAGVLDSIYSVGVNHDQACHASPDGAAV
jgi:Ethanolamine utilization protein EutJ (predicted chaperonin)